MQHLHINAKAKYAYNNFIILSFTGRVEQTLKNKQKIFKIIDAKFVLIFIEKYIKIK